MCVFCADILDILTQNFFSEKGKHIEEKAHVEDVKVYLRLIHFYFHDNDTVCPETS